MSWLPWALLSAVFAGATAILAKIALTGAGSHLATAIRTSFVLILSWSVAMATREIGAIGTLSKRTWIFLALSGLATGLSWLCYFRALQLGNASQVAPIDKTSVVFVLIFAAMFLNEPLTSRTLIGTGLILGGIVTLSFK